MKLAHAHGWIGAHHVRFEVGKDLVRYGSQKKINCSLTEVIINDVVKVAGEGKAEIVDSTPIVALARTGIVSFEGSSRGVLFGDGVAVIGPQRIEPLSGGIRLEIQGDAFGFELLFEGALAAGALDNVSAVKTIHAVCAENSSLGTSDFTVFFNSGAERVEGGAKGVHENANVFEFHASADAVEVKPLEADFRATDTIFIVQLGSVFLILLSDLCLTAMFIDEQRDLYAAILAYQVCKMPLERCVICLIRVLQDRNWLERIW